MRTWRGRRNTGGGKRNGRSREKEGKARGKREKEEGREMGSGREAAQYLPHLRGKEVYPAGEAGAELGGIAGMAEREGSKRKVGVR